MTQFASRGSAITVKPQPNIYTMLLIVAALALAVAIGFMLYNLLASPPSGYGLEFGQIFNPDPGNLPGLGK